jgi:sigma-B regulation protein RsbU (phosphoserine phosphatase)
MKNKQTKTADDILIVDDTPANLRLLTQMLAKRGYGVRAVTNGMRALDSVRATPPSLILLDIRMPEMDGYEVCERIKADAQTQDIPIIFISALNEIQDKVRGFNVGGVDYITKPFQFEEVLARVETHLALRNLQSELQEANIRYEQELALAGSLQTSFLPSKPPNIPGWQLSLTLKPARETSGDFYDVFPLPDGHFGMLVADVVDKGASAALYMALSLTIIRTYTAEYPTKPELVLQAANQRIIENTDGSRFVTVFYAVLDPQSGELAYCNAGHNPPLLVDGRKDGEIRKLSKTGMLLGAFEDQTWKQGVASLMPGDTLILYTDGITEAQNEQGALFGLERLIAEVGSKDAVSTDHLQDHIIQKVHGFMGSAPQTDDIAMIVVARNR